MSVAVTLPVPPGNGTAAPASTANMSAKKTIIVAGTFRAAVVVEASAGGGDFCEIAVFTAGGKKQIDVSAVEMRVTIKGFISGAPTVDVTADPADVTVASPPATAGNGAGASVDVSGLSSMTTIYVLGTFTGIVTVEVSEDGTNWAAGFPSFQGPDCRSASVAAQFMRVVRSGINPLSPGLPVVYAAADKVSAGGKLDLVSFSGTVNVYVDGGSGSDNNDGLTPTSALATLGEVYQKFPLFTMSGGRIIVNLAGVGGFGASATAERIYTARSLWVGGGEAYLNSYVYKGPQMVPFTPATGPSTAPLDAIPAVNLTNQTRFDFTAAAPGWTVNNLRFRFLRVTRAGAKVIFELPISGNTADTITVDVGALAGLILPTDTATVVTPGAVINPIGVPSVGVDGLRLLGTGGSSQPFISSTAFNTLGFVFERITFGIMVTILPPGTSFDRCRFTSSEFFQGGSLYFINCAGGTFIIDDVATVNGTTTLGSRPDVAGSDPINALSAQQCEIIATSMALGQQRGNAVYLAQRNCSFYGSATLSGLLVSGPCMFFASALFFPVALQGSGHAGAGIKARQGGTVRVNPGSATTITGATGALKVDTGAAVAYGAGVGEFEEVAGWNGNFTRVLEGTATAPTGAPSRITTQNPGVT